MAYVSFLDDKPVISDLGDAVINNTRENLMALRDAIASGVLEDWNLSVTIGGGSAEEPDLIQWRSGQGVGADRVRASITWGTSGGADGNPTAILYEFSVDGAVWDVIGTLTYTYSSGGDVTGATWA